MADTEEDMDTTVDTSISEDTGSTTSNETSATDEDTFTITEEDIGKIIETYKDWSVDPPKDTGEPKSDISYLTINGVQNPIRDNLAENRITRTHEDLINVATGADKVDDFLNKKININTTDITTNTNDIDALWDDPLIGVMWKHEDESKTPSLDDNGNRIPSEEAYLNDYFKNHPLDGEYIQSGSMPINRIRGYGAVQYANVSETYEETFAYPYNDEWGQSLFTQDLDNDNTIDAFAVKWTRLDSVETTESENIKSGKFCSLVNIEKGWPINYLSVGSILTFKAELACWDFYTDSDTGTTEEKLYDGYARAAIFASNNGNEWTEIPTAIVSTNDEDSSNVQKAQNATVADYTSTDCVNFYPIKWDETNYFINQDKTKRQIEGSTTMPTGSCRLAWYVVPDTLINNYKYWKPAIIFTNEAVDLDTTTGAYDYSADINGRFSGVSVELAYSSSGGAAYTTITAQKISAAIGQLGCTIADSAGIHSGKNAYNDENQGFYLAKNGQVGIGTIRPTGDTEEPWEGSGLLWTGNSDGDDGKLVLRAHELYLGDNIVLIQDDIDSNNNALRTEWQKNITDSEGNTKEFVAKSYVSGDTFQETVQQINKDINNTTTSIESTNETLTEQGKTITSVQENLKENYVLTSTFETTVNGFTDTISNSSKTASSYLKWSNNGLEVGQVSSTDESAWTSDRIRLETTGTMKILNKSGSELAHFSANDVSLASGKATFTETSVSLCDGAAKIEYSTSLKNGTYSKYKTNNANGLVISAPGNSDDIIIDASSTDNLLLYGKNIYANGYLLSELGSNNISDTIYYCPHSNHGKWATEPLSLYESGNYDYRIQWKETYSNGIKTATGVLDLRKLSAKDGIWGATKQDWVGVANDNDSFNRAYYCKLGVSIPSGMFWQDGTATSPTTVMVGGSNIVWGCGASYAGDKDYNKWSATRFIVDLITPYLYEDNGYWYHSVEMIMFTLIGPYEK